MARLFKRLADQCVFIPADCSGQFTRLVSLDDNGSEIASSSNEYVPELICRAEFLQADGAVTSGDEFTMNSTGQKGRLTQRVSMDSVFVAYIYIALE